MTFQDPGRPAIADEGCVDDRAGPARTGEANARPSVRRGIEWAKEKYSRSSARSLSRRLVALDFMNLAMALAGTVLLCVFPFLIVMSALIGRSAASTFSRHLGLNQQAAADMGHLFNSSVLHLPLRGE